MIWISDLRDASQRYSKIRSVGKDFKSASLPTVLSSCTALNAYSSRMGEGREAMKTSKVLTFPTVLSRIV